MLVRIRSLRAASHGPRGMVPATTASPSADGSGGSSTKPKRRRNAVSKSAMERSAVFMVPMTKMLGGTENRSPDNGSQAGRPRLSDSSKVNRSEEHTSEL